MTCPACRHPRSRAAMRVREHAFRRCARCASLFVAEPPPAEALAGLYADERYFVNPDFASPETDGFHGYLDYLADRAHIEAKFDAVLARLERGRPPGRLLDVGAGPGLMVAAAARRGWAAEGIDLNPWAVRHAREVIGVGVREGRLEAETQTYDALTLMDVVEHVPDVDALLGAARRALAAGGALAVLTPDAGSPVSRLLGARWPEVKRAPEHLVLFSARGLTAALERHGFTVLDRHSVGKTSTVGTLMADVLPAAPGLARGLGRLAERSGLAERTFELDPHTKFCLYARAGR